jgi:hypothetical protein
MVYKADTYGRSDEAIAWPGRVAAMLGAGATVLAAAASSLPATDYLLAGVSWSLALVACGIVAVRERPRWHRAAGIAVVAACFGAATFTDLSLRYRFQTSEDAMTAFAQDAIVNVRAEPIGPIRIGGYQFEQVRYRPELGYVEFSLDASTGFLYDPARHPLPGRTETHRPLTKGWYTRTP